MAVYDSEGLKARNETAEVKMKLLDKLLERNLITSYDYNEELKLMANAMNITLNRAEEEANKKNAKKGFFK